MKRWLTAGLMIAAVGAFGLMVAMRSGREQELAMAPKSPQTNPDDAAGARPAGQPNRLADEKSPYLLQHASNPVDWYAWGEEAFAKARAENKPIFLSIGYSTCHWCHVMARESFADNDTAVLLNRYFVAVKVDREERPDVDRVYMAFVQATTGSGGWPLSVWLTPELKPFYGGTYFPPQDRYGMVGFKAVLQQLADLWAKDRRRLLSTGDAVITRLRQSTARGAAATGGLKDSALDLGFAQLASSYEPDFGGFGNAPKFPQPSILNFLFRQHARTGVPKALEMSLFTLRKMAEGGMHDHLGGGFHRYSVDNEWHVPHFEKMLYDQAQLASVYLDAFQVTHDPFHAEVARATLDYVLRDLRGEEGQFHSAEDADSPVPGRPEHHAEGAFYVWTQDEIRQGLGAGPAALFSARFGVGPRGNVANDPHGEFPGKNVLRIRQSISELAQSAGRSAEEVTSLLDQAKAALLALRSQRQRPHLDDKALTGWNGLMISALARAAQVLDEPRYLAAAQQAAAFCQARLYDPTRRRLLRRYRAGEATIDGYADDYAFLIRGLLDLYEAAFEPRHLAWAMDLQKTQDECFRDESGGYYSTTGDDPTILLRLKEDYDGAEPSASSVSALNLLRLAQFTGKREFRSLAEATLTAFAASLDQHPSAMPQMLVALCFALDAPRQVVIVGKPGAVDTLAMLRAVHADFVPNKVLLLAAEGSSQRALTAELGFLPDLKMVDGRATAYLCENYACQLPTTHPETLRQQLLTAAPALAPASTTPPANTHGTARELPPLLRIDWHEGPEYPLGIQDSVCAAMGGRFVSAGGFSRHAKDVLKAHPDAFGGAPNGFTSLVFAFDPVRAGAGWERLPDIPGAPRQGAAGAVVGEELYAVGGFSYSEPLSYREGWRLRTTSGTAPQSATPWERLPDLPWPLCEACAVTIGTRIYLLCAADYFKAPGEANADFHSQSGRFGDPVGSALLMLDSADLASGWRRLADMPGVPKFDAGVAAAGGRIYVLGGIFAPTREDGPGPYSDGTASYHYYNTVDSWVYDPPTDAWSRLPDLPDGANRRALAFRDRYIVLAGGYKYPQTWLPDGTRRDAYSDEEKKRDWKAFFETSVLVFDTETLRLGTAEPLPERTSWPGGAVLGDTLFVLGGEGGRLWHPATFQTGKVSLLQP